MSTTIDERVVEMRFDNSNFKKNAGETVGLLEKLKNALNFSGSSGLDGLNKSARNVDLNPLARSVEAIHQNFTALEVAAVTALVNITNRAVDAGISLVKNLSIDQITEGWDKYAKKTSSVQTIMAATAQDFTNTGEQMEYVNEQLEKLNWFTDETSYNFVDMVNNIGKFTSNNIALDDSVTAMQGIATWAALSGANASEASRAMYNLSQAVATGSVKLIDWKSIENANMATAQFKQTAIETAVEMGLLKKKSDGVYKSIKKGTTVTIAEFNASLASGWFTSDVLLNTLDKYGSFTNVLNRVSETTGITATELLQYMDAYRAAGTNTEAVLEDMADAARESGVTVKELASFMDELTDSSYELGEKAFRAAQEAKTFEEAITATKDAVSTGWMNTWEIIFGDYEQAKQIWTGLANELYDVFAAGAETRNALLKKALALPEEYLDQSTSSWNNLTKQIKTAGVSSEEFANQCYEVTKQLGMLDELSISSFEEFRESLKDGWFTSEALIATLNSLMGPFANASGMASEATTTFEEFQEVLGQINRKELGQGDELLRNLAESGWNVVAMQEAANKLLNKSEITMDDYKAALEEMTFLEYEKLGYDKRTIENLKRLREAYSDTALEIVDDGDAISKWWTGTEFLFTGISQGWNAIKNIFSAIGEGWNIAFPPMTVERLYGILETFKDLTSAFNEWVGFTTKAGKEPVGIANDIRDSMAGLASVFGLLIDVAKELVSYIFEAFGGTGALGSGIKTVLNFTGRTGDLLVAFRKWVKENNIIRKGIETIVSWISKAAKEVKGWIISFTELPFVHSIIVEIQNKVQKFVTLIQNSFPRVTSLVKDLWSRFKELAKNKDFSGMIELIKELASAFKNDLSEAFETVDGKFPSIVDIFNKLVSYFKNLNTTKFPKWAQGLYNVVSAFLVPVISIFSAFVNMLKDVSKNADSIFDFLTDIIKQFATGISENFGAIITAFVAYKVGKTIYEFAKSLWSVLNILSSPIKAIVNAFNGFRDAAKSLGKAFNAFAVVEAAIAIAILGFTLAKLGSLSKEELTRGIIAVGVLTGLIAALLGLTWFLEKKGGLGDGAKKAKIQSSAALKLIFLAGAIYSIASAFIKLSSFLAGKTFNDMKAPLIALGAIIGILVGFTILLNKLGHGAEFSDAVAILSIAVSIRIIVSALDDILTFVNNIGSDRAKFNTALNTLIVIVFSLGILILALGALNKSSGGGKNAGIGLLAAAIAIKILVSVLNDIHKFASQEGADKSIDALIGFAIGLGIFMFALSKMGGNAKNAGVGVLAASAGIWILVRVIKQLSSMTASDIFKGVIAIGALMIFMGLMIRIAGSAKSFESLKAAAAFLAVSAALLILVGAVALMSLMDPGRLMIATAAMSILMIAFGILLACASLVKDVKPTYFVSLAIVLGVLATSIILLGGMDPGAVLVGVAAMTALMGATSIMMLFMRAIKGISVWPIFALGGIILALAGAIRMLASLNPAGVIVAVAALKAIMNAFSVMLVVLGVVTRIGNFSTPAVVALGIIGAIVIALGLVIGYLVEKIGPAGAGAALLIAGSLTALMIGMAVLMVAVGKLGKLDPKTTLFGILGMVEILGVFIILAAILGELNEAVPGISEAIEKSFPLLRNLGRVVGEVAGGFIEGLLGIDTGGLSEKLTSFGEAVSSFAESIKSVDEGAVTAIKAVIEMLLAMAGADLINAITSWFGGDTTSLSAFGEELESFGPMLVSFSDSISGGKIDTQAIEDAADAATSLTKLANNLPRSGGFVGTLLGDRATLSTFGEDITTFGQALVDYCKVLSEGKINTKLITTSAEAAEELSDLQNNLPSLNGWSQKLTGNPQTLSEFGSGLETFGEALVTYNTKLGEVTDWDLFETSVTAAQLLVDLGNTLGTDDGWINKVFGGGQTDLSEFGVTLGVFAQGLVDYSTTAANINTTGLENAQTLVDYFLKTAGDARIEKANKLDDLGGHIMTLGFDLSQYYTSISRIKAEQLSSVVSSLSIIVSLIQDMNKLEAGSAAKFSEALTSLAGVSLDDFCSVFENSSTRVTNAINTLAHNAAVAASNSSSGFVDAGVYSVGFYLTGLLSDKADFAGTATLLVDKVVTALNESATKFKEAGISLDESFIDGLMFNFTGLYNVGASLADQALRGLSKPSVETGAYTSGKNVALGFRNGMVDNQSIVATAAYNLGRKAIENLQLAIDAHSPSRESTTLGEYTGVGFVNGILRFIQRAANAGEELGLAPLETLRAAIQNVPYLLANDINLNPVISPVIDLTGAQASAATLNSMFNRSIGMSAALAGATGGAFERARAGSTAVISENGVNKTPIDTQEQMVQYNTFNITSNDPEAVASAVSYRLQKQVERKKSTWAQSTGTGYPRVRSQS